MQLSLAVAAMPFASTHPPSLRRGAFWIGGSVLDSNATSGRVVLLSKMQSSTHIMTRLPQLRHDGPRTIPRLHATTTAPLPLTHDEAGETQWITPASCAQRRRDQCPGQLRIDVSAATE